MKHYYNKEVKDIIKNIQSYENEESCIIILSQEQNKALLNYINTLEKDNGDIIKLFAKEREETKRLHSIIKEVRKYVQTMYTYGIKNNSLQRNELLEILDKVGETDVKN